MKNKNKDKYRQLFSNKPRLIIIIVSIVLLGLIIFSDYGLIKRIDLEVQTNALQKEIVMQKEISNSMRQKINKLRNDMLEIEKIAREKYGMTRPNEDVYYIKEPQLIDSNANDSTNN